MKKYFYLFFLSLCFICGACSKGTETVIPEPLGPQPVDPLSHLSENEKKIVGCWDEGWIFFPDKTCCYISYNGYDVYREYGEWTYDDITKFLTTTVDSKQYKMSLLSENSWAGINLGTGNTVSWHRYNIGYAGEQISKKQWKGKSNIRISCDTYYTGQGLTFSRMIWKLTGWENDNAFPEIKDPSEFYENGEYRLHGYYTDVHVERSIKVSKASFVSNTTLLLEATIGDDYYWTDEGYGYKTHLHRENIFQGTILLDDMYSTNPKLKIEGTMNGQPFNRDYQAG